MEWNTERSLQYKFIVNFTESNKKFFDFMHKHASDSFYYFINL